MPAELESPFPMNQGRTCPECGSRLPTMISQGLCPLCFLDMQPHEPFIDGSYQDRICEDLAAQGFFKAELIGLGGMGCVFKAYQESLKRTVAVKVLMPSFSLDRMHIHKFLLEARAAANLQHPNILPIYEVGEWDGSPYYVSRWMPAGNLADWNKKRWANANSQEFKSEKYGLPTNHQQKIAQWMIQIGEAVECAHQSGIIHRDLKPSNILLDEDLQPFIADFGLAEIANESSTMVSSRLFAGTPQYMAPELVETNKATIRSDVYSLGMVLYELLTGHCPFDQEISFQLLRTIVEKRLPSPKEIDRNIDRSLSVICMKCLEKNPALRYESAQALVDDLVRYSRGYPVRAAPVSSLENLLYWAQRNPVLATLTFGFLALSLGFILFLGSANHRLSEQEIHLAREASHAKFLIADRNLENPEKSTDALLQLIDAIRLNPDHHLASYRFMANLLHRPIPDISKGVIHHPSAVSDIAVDPKGTKLISAGYDSLIRVWDLNQPNHLWRSWMSTNFMNEIVIDPSGQWMAMVGTTIKPHVYNLNDYRDVMKWEGFPLFTYTTVFHPSAKWVVTGAYDGFVRVWDFSKDAVEIRIPLGSPVLCMTFDRNGEQLAVGCKDGSVKVWDWPIENPMQKPLYEFSHPKEVSCLLYEDNGYRYHIDTLVSGCNDGFVRGWDKKTGQQRWITKQNLGAPVTSMVLASTEKHLARILVGASNGTVTSLWTLHGDPMSLPMSLHSSVTRLIFSPSTGKVFAALKNGDVVSWKLGLERLVSQTSGCGSIPIIFGLAPGGNELILATLNREISTIKAGPLKEPKRSTKAKGNLTSMAFFPDRKAVFLGFHDNRSEIWRLDSMDKGPERVIDHAGVVMGVEISPSGNLFASFDYSGLVHVFASDRLDAPLRILKNSIGVNGIVFLEKEMACLTVSNDNHVRWWNLLDSKDPKVIFDHTDHVKSIDISGDQNLVVTGSSDFTVALLDVSGGPDHVKVRTLQAGARVDKVKITSESKYIVATTGNSLDYGDFNLIIWDLSLEPPKRIVIPFNGYIQDFDFNKEEKAVVTADWSGLARMWDLESGLPLTPAFRDDVGTTQVELSPDEGTLYTASNNNSIKAWNLPPKDLSIPAWFLDYVEDHIKHNFLLRGDSVTPETYIPAETPSKDYFARLAKWMKYRNSGYTFKPSDEFLKALDDRFPSLD